MNLDKNAAYAVISACILVIITSIYFIVFSLTQQIENPMMGMMGGMMGYNQPIYRPWYTTLLPLLTLASYDYFEKLPFSHNPPEIFLPPFHHQHIPLLFYPFTLLIPLISQPS